MTWYVAFFFRLLNFCAFASIAYYVYIRYLAPTIQEGILKEQLQELMNQQKQQTLERTCAESAAQMEKERLAFMTIKDRIVTWKSITENKMKKDHEQLEIFQHKLNERSVLQQQNQNRFIMQREETEKVLTAVLAGIYKKYSFMEAKEQFSTLVIDSLAARKKSNL